MKNLKTTIIASLLLTSLMFNYAIGQDNASTTTKANNPIKLGLKGGLNICNLFVQDKNTMKFIAGFNAGFFAKLPITRVLAIQPELYFTTKGAIVNYDAAFIKGSIRYNLNYIEMPVLICLNLSDNFNIHFGPYLAYLINGKATNDSNIDFLDFQTKINTEDYNNWDYGLAIGAGLDLGRLGLGARYNFGLTKIGREQTILGNSYTFPDASNGVFNLYVSFSII